MKGLSYSFLRAVCALVIGLVLVMFPNQAGDYFVITIGVIFLVPSLISIIGYYAQNAEVPPPHSLSEGIGSLFIWTMAGYYAGLFCRFADVRAGLYPRDGWCAADSLAVGCPQMDACAGRILRCSGGYIAGWAGCAVQSYGRAFYGVFIIIGITSLVYAVSELINWFKFTRLRPKVPVTGSKSDDDIERCKDNRMMYMF